MTHGAAALSPALAELAADYELLGELGRGGHAVVYRARDRALGRLVAIKVVYPRHPVPGDDDAVARLAREARTVAQLQHPNIVTVFNVHRLHGGGLALVMPLVPGKTLKQIVQDEGPLPPDRCERVMRDVAAALAYAHARGVVHRDVKPENIFLDEDAGRALLADFGIALSDEHDSATLTGTAIGTPFYMSPEQIDGAALDGRSDLYSLGLVAWEMLTGRRPWDGESLYNVIYKQKHEELPPIEALRPGVAPRLQYIVERMLQKQPSARWAGADGLLAQLSHTVLPRDYAKWQSTLRKRVERYRAEERARATAKPAAGEGAAGSGLAAATMRIIRGAMRVAPSEAPGLANTVSLQLPPELRVSEPPAAPALPEPPESEQPPDEAEPAPEPVAPVERYTPRRGMRAQAPRSRRRGAVLAGMFALAALSAAAVVWVVPARWVETLLDRVLPPRVATRQATLPSPTAPTTSSPAATEAAPAGAPSAAAPGSPPGDLLVPVGRAATTVAAGGRHSCLVSSDATVHCWGANERGQLGDATLQRRTVPSRVVGDLAFTQVASGTAHSCAVTRVGDVYCWGINGRGQLGDATNVRRDAPVRVAGAGVYRAVRAGGTHSCGVTFDGAVLCWGANDRGQLGDGTHAARSRPTPVRAPSGALFVAVSAGGAHTCALTDGAAAYCWGANDAGQLGDGARDDRAVPTPVAGGLRLAALATGQAHSCGVTPAGEVYCWGRNSFGQLGTGVPGVTPTPTRVPLPRAAAALVAGTVHTCALTTAGEAYCWGRNAYGQLGDGTLADRGRPARVRVGQPLSEIDATALHTCGLSFAGAAMCWGYNGEGQLGDSTLANRALPTPVRLGSLAPAAPVVQTSPR